MNDSNFTVSYSALSAYMSCEFKSALSTQFEPVEKARPLVLGTLVHLGLSVALEKMARVNYDYIPYADIARVIDDYINANRTVKIPIVFEGLTIVDDNSIDYEELRANAYDVVVRTINHLELGKRWIVALDGEGNPIIERRFQVPMIENPAIDFVMVVDTILVEPETGEAWVVDWKVRKSMQNDLLTSNSGTARDDFNVQVSLYQKALQPLLKGYGYYLNGAIVYQISDRLPETPKLNKTAPGKPLVMSRSKIKTDWETYSTTLIEHGIDPADYKDMESALADVVFWQPLYIRQVATEVNNRWELMKRWAIRLYNFRNSDIEPLRHISAGCQFCDFARVCMGIDRNHDVSVILATDYKKREKR